MSATAELEQYARFLRNAAPQEFDKFRAAFAAYTRYMTDALVNSTTEFQVAQGRAQQCVKILRLLEEIKNG